jgi:hypothetical protein
VRRNDESQRNLCREPKTFSKACLYLRSNCEHNLITDESNFMAVAKKKKAGAKKGNPCWKGYQQLGMKKKGGKMVPNCVTNKAK